RPSVPYDLLSINTGSTPNVRQVKGAQAHAVPVKPIAQFNQRWLRLLERVRELHGRFTIAVVGGGAGGVELVLSMQYRLRQELQTLGRNPDLLHFVLLTADDTILPTHNPSVRERFLRVLQARHVSVHTRAKVTEVSPGCLHTQDERTFDADETLWVTQAGGPAWLQSTGLALDKQGFIQVNEQLQSLNDPKVFAAGDVASFTARPLEKAGVFAVRMGPPLVKNLRLHLRGQPLAAYKPQRSWLALISTGDRYAVASRGRLGFAGAWVWSWKDWIDRRFMTKFNELPKMAVTLPRRHSPLADRDALAQIESVPMRCGGCGAKVGASVLSRALEGIVPAQRPEIVAGLDDPDDAALIDTGGDTLMVHTVDYFRAMIDDPYLFGRIAANHALSDIYAMGGKPQTALAIATLPHGIETKLEADLAALMAGANETLRKADCALVGGHTSEGAELALGFAVTGAVPRASALRKSGARPGDRLILTKPLGTGTLLAANMRAEAKARWLMGAIDTMLLSNGPAADILMQSGARAATDITGFGLLGHLLEMLKASGAAARIDLEALPVLDGARHTLAQGITSSLQPQNLRLRRAIVRSDGQQGHALFPLLFDPQTSGGLLAAIPPEASRACLQRLSDAGYPGAAVIGEITASDGSAEIIRLTAGETVASAAL
ncbi:MAG: selenide, water dikinase SelD, partial [Hyphomicrobiaceae bacterium]